MLVQKAFKFELRPNGEQLRSFARYAGCRRFLYNKALAFHNERYAQEKPFLSYAQLSAAELLKWKVEHSWLSECHSQVLQQSLKDLDMAFKRFFKGLADKPTFKKKSKHDSFRFPQIKINAIDEANSRINLPKLGWVRYRNSRKITGKPKNITISRQGEKWFVSIQTEQVVEKPIPKSSSAIGVDVGIVNFVALSDGSCIEPVNAFKSLQANLARLQKDLARKVEFSNNWKKQRKKITQLHIRIADVRRNHQHQISNRLSQNHAMIAVEDLKVGQMSKSAKGTLENPGKNVLAKSGLNKAILDQGWGEFRRQLVYKAAWRGAMVVAVPAHHTSQMCPRCGHTHSDNRKTQARFEVSVMPVPPFRLR